MTLILHHSKLIIRYSLFNKIMRVGIIGSGTMGSGIAQVAATSGCKVKLYDTNQSVLDKSKEALEKVLSRLIEKGRID